MSWYPGNIPTSSQAPPPPPPPVPNAAYGMQLTGYNYANTFSYPTNYSTRHGSHARQQLPPPPPPHPPAAYPGNYSFNSSIPAAGRGCPYTMASPLIMNQHNRQHQPQQRYPQTSPFPRHPAAPHCHAQNSNIGNSRKRKERSGSREHHQEPQKQKHEQQQLLPQQKYSCDVCQFHVDSQQALQAHLKSHIQCKECEFQGAPKIVKAHHQTVHGAFSKGGFKTVTVAVPGCKVQRFRICVGNRPEDIQQWIAERKKRFPRQQQQQESNASRQNTTNIHLITKQSTGKTGVAALLDGYGSSSSEREGAKNKEESEVAGEIHIQNDTATNVSTAPTTSITKDHPPGYRTRSCRFFARFGKCRNGEACHFHHERLNGNDHSSQPLLPGQEQQQQRQPQTRPQKQQQLPRKNPPKSLLRSMHAKEIQ
jgi:hypothetical protein